MPHGENIAYSSKREQDKSGCLSRGITGRLRRKGLHTSKKGLHWRATKSRDDLPAFALSEKLLKNYYQYAKNYYEF